MGSGTWSSATYSAVSGAKIRAGATFDYSARATGVHEKLDPKRLNAAGHFANKCFSNTRSCSYCEAYQISTSYKLLFQQSFQLHYRKEIIRFNIGWRVIDTNLSLLNNGSDLLCLSQ